MSVVRFVVRRFCCLSARSSLSSRCTWARANGVYLLVCHSSVSRRQGLPTADKEIRMPTHKFSRAHSLRRSLLLAVWCFPFHRTLIFRLASGAASVAVWVCVRMSSIRSKWTNERANNMWASAAAVRPAVGTSHLRFIVNFEFSQLENETFPAAAVTIQPHLQHTNCVQCSMQRPHKTKRR